MKFLAILQIVCILFLSSWSGAAKPVVPTVKFDCCKKAAKTDNCAKKKSNERGNCDSRNCNMMLTCGICGFLTVDALTVKPVICIIVENPVALYKIGNMPDYFASNWKPPKVKVNIPIELYG